AAVAPSIAVAVRHISGTPLAERYLYLPSVGLALLLGIVCCLPFLGNWVKPARWLVILLIGVYVAAGIERGMVWISNEKLWIDTTNKLPSHGEPWNLLGIEYLEQRKYAKALQAFQRAITAQNNATGRSYAKRNIAVIYQLQNDSQRAKEFYLSALEERDDNPEALHGLGVIYLDEARNIEQEGDGEDQVAAKLNRAVAYFAATLGLNSYHVEARWGLVTALANLGRRYELQRNPEQAVQHYQSALAEVTTLIAHDPALQSRQDIQNTRAGIRSALQRLAR
ncbi:MAG: tetratricopeptide repeat protein, partial [Gammaproteobacteria bacterium]|nr:tetratricopeptide repeat protein [Gammaproteobacteria bacterium]